MNIHALVKHRMKENELYEQIWLQDHTKIIQLLNFQGSLIYLSIYLSRVSGGQIKDM